MIIFFGPAPFADLPWLERGLIFFLFRWGAQPHPSHAMKVGKVLVAVVLLIEEARLPQIIQSLALSFRIQNLVADVIFQLSVLVEHQRPTAINCDLKLWRHSFRHGEFT